jgi:hypothetical protein
MRKSLIVGALCALWIIGNTSQAATITVFHGSVTETFDTAKTPAGGVHIARPAVTPVSTPSPARARRAARPYVVNAAVAGDTLWIRSRRTGRLVACTVGSSGMVGKRVIRCTGPDAFGR